MLNKSAVDQIGNMLRETITVDALRSLDQYRREFRTDYDVVVDKIRSNLGVEVSGRPAKSTTAIVDKLRRGSMRLSQMQDIAGCRIVVSDISSQDAVVGDLRESFNSIIVDRRARPSHGYRAVHVIARQGSIPIEVQIRTSLQHLWAELSEKLSDKYGGDIKYGGGDPVLRKSLEDMSLLVAGVENLEGELAVAERVLTLRSDLAKHMSGIIQKELGFI